MTETGHGRHVVVIGAGPAGLTAAHELTRFNVRPTVLEQSGTVGGLARTEEYKGFRFDMGGHRFFSKVDEITKLWHEVLGENFLTRPRARSPLTTGIMIARTPQTRQGRSARTARCVACPPSGRAAARRRHK